MAQNVGSIQPLDAWNWTIQYPSRRWETWFCCIILWIVTSCYLRMHKQRPFENDWKRAKITSTVLDVPRQKLQFASASGSSSDLPVSSETGQCPSTGLCRAYEQYNKGENLLLCRHKSIIIIRIQMDDTSSLILLTPCSFPSFLMNRSRLCLMIDWNSLTERVCDDDDLQSGAWNKSISLSLTSSF